MKEFAVICLIVILITIQHLINFVCRKDKDFIFSFMSIIFGIFITILGGKYLAIWLVDLMK